MHRKIILIVFGFLILTGCKTINNVVVKQKEIHIIKDVDLTYIELATMCTPNASVIYAENGMKPLNGYEFVSIDKEITLDVFTSDVQQQFVCRFISQ